MPTADIDEVLAASSHYEVLGIQPQDAADGPTLRRAYLEKSVRVHPDKNNGEPRATEAFQKVALAYNVLADDDSRTRYEKYGGTTTDDFSLGPEEEESSAPRAQPPPPPPSFRDAMFLFVSVASMMGGAQAGCVTDAAQAMYFAETFLSNNNNRGGMDLKDGKAKAQAAMATGATLRVVGTAVRAMGLTQTAAALNSAATLVQVAGIGAMVADSEPVKRALEQPAVKRTIDVGSQKMAQLGSGINAAREAMRNRAETKP